MYVTSGGGGVGSVHAFDACTATYSPSVLTLYPFIGLRRVSALRQAKDKLTQAYKTIHHKGTKGTKGGREREEFRIQKPGVRRQKVEKTTGTQRSRRKQPGPGFREKWGKG